MKNRMRLTAILAGAAMLCGSIPAAPVSALYCWGTADDNEFHDMTLLDDKEMLGGFPTGSLIGTADDYQVYTYHYSFDRENTWTDLDTGETKTELHHYEGNPIYVICPRKNVLRIGLRKELDHDEAEQKMYAILDRYYPGIRSNDCQTCSVYQVTYGVPDLEYYYDLVDRSESIQTEEAKTAGSPEISDGIMHDLAEAGLISEFYTWGQTANYIEVSALTKDGSPTIYNPTGQKWNEDYTKLETVYYDWDAIEAYVKKQYPKCEFIHATLEDIELTKKIGYYDYEQNRVNFGNYDEMYAVIPPEGTTFPEHFAIAAELYAEFGISCEWVSPASVSSPLIGQNSLAVAGDTDVNGSVDVSDAVLLARFCAEESTAVITEQGKQNADANRDGNIMLDDVTMILKIIAKL